MKQSAAAAANQQNQQSANSTWAADPEAQGLPWGRAHAATLTLSGLHRLPETRRQLAAQRLAWEMNQRLGF